MIVNFDNDNLLDITALHWFIFIIVWCILDNRRKMVFIMTSFGMRILYTQLVVQNYFSTLFYIYLEKSFYPLFFQIIVVQLLISFTIYLFHFLIWVSFMFPSLSSMMKWANNYAQLIRYS